MITVQYTHEKCRELLDFLEEIGDAPATDEQLQKALVLIEESNRLGAAWAQTPEGIDFTMKLVEENMQDCEAMFQRIQSTVETGNEYLTNDLTMGIINKVLDELVKVYPDLDADLLVTTLKPWQEFLQSHDHLNRVIELALQAA